MSNPMCLNECRKMTAEDIEDLRELLLHGLRISAEVESQCREKVLATKISKNSRGLALRLGSRGWKNNRCLSASAQGQSATSAMGPG